MAELAYIDITRRFRALSDAPRREGRGFARAFGYDAPTTWDSLLVPNAGAQATRAVVVVAASSAGKSTEAEQQSLRLKRHGHFAFLVQAPSVAADGFMNALERDDARDFAAWQGTTKRAVFFVDAVDQVYLRQRTLRELLRALDRGIDFATRDFQIVLTARTGTWGPSDRRELERGLRTAATQTVSEWTFESIDLEGFRQIAEASGVADVDEMMRQVEENEIDQIIDELRPPDVKLLVEHWQRNRRFGTWTEILSGYVGASLEDADPNRDRSRSLTLVGGWLAAERIAAAAALAKTPHIVLPAHAPVPGAIAARRLLEDWPLSTMSELFETGLFAHRGEEAVQLPQGAASHFLAARWLRDRFRAGMEVDELFHLLMVRIYGEEHWRMPGSRRALMGWVASDVGDIRSYLVEEHASVVLYEGDPDRLSMKEISVALASVVASIAGGEFRPRPTNGTLKKLARPEVETAVLSLMKQYRRVPDALAHLLPYVEVGRYRTGIPLALRLALSSRAKLVTRILAIRAVGAAGDPSDIQQILSLATAPQEMIRSEVLPIAIGHGLTGPKLVGLLVSGRESAFRVQLAHNVKGVGVKDLESAIQGLRPQVLPPRDPRSPEDDDAPSLEVLSILITARLRHATSPAWMGECLFELEQALQWTHLYGPDRRALEEALASNSDARRALWLAKLAAVVTKSAAASLVIQPRLGTLALSDLPWLLTSYEDLGDGRAAAQWSLRMLWSSLTQDRREEVRTALAASGAVLPPFLEPSESAPSAIPAPDTKLQRAAEIANAREKNQAFLSPRAAAIASGDDVSALLWAWGHLPEGHDRERRIDFGRLQELVGPDLVEAFKAGLKRLWRQQEVPLQEPGDPNIPLRILAGLTGLTLEIREGLDLSSLTQAEAELACRYALYELNALPVWFEDLLNVHAVAVRLILEEALRIEWSATVEHHGIVRLATLEPPATSALMREIIVELLASGPPRNKATVGYAARALVTSTADSNKVLASVKRALEETSTANEELVGSWLRVWAHFDPEGAARWLLVVRRRNPERFATLVQRVAAVIHEDLELVSDRVSATAMLSPAGLLTWIRLVFLAVRPADDVRHRGAHWVGQRERAESFRGRLVEALARDTTLEARQALVKLSRDRSMVSHRPLIERLLLQQESLACEAEARPWTEEEVLAVERGDERPPKTLGDLFNVLRRHIHRVARMIENDDFRYPELFGPKTPERDIQLWVASCLKQVARGLYSVVRENVVARDKEVDISALADGVGRIPIEIKPLGPYSPAQLSSTISVQLMGRYMQPPGATHGLLLVVRRRDRHWWRVGGKRVDLSGLVKMLRAKATKLGGAAGKVIGVESIDLAV